MTHLVAFTIFIIGTGLIAKFFPKVMTWIFNQFPAHFKPHDSSRATTATTETSPTPFEK